MGNIDFPPADPERDKEELLALQQEIFLTDRFETWTGLKVFFVQLEGEGNVGSVAFAPHFTAGASYDEGISSEGTLWLVDIGIRPAFQRQGLAAKTLEWAKAWALVAGFWRMTSNFRVSNQASRSLHYNAGFLYDRIIHGYYKNPVEDAQLVEFTF